MMQRLARVVAPRTEESDVVNMFDCMAYVHVITRQPDKVRVHIVDSFLIDFTRNLCLTRIVYYGPRLKGYAVPHVCLL